MNNNQTIANSGGNFYMARILGYTVPTTADPDGGPAESVGGAGAFFKLNDTGVGLRTTAGTIFPSISPTWTSSFMWTARSPKPSSTLSP